MEGFHPVVKEGYFIHVPFINISKFWKKAHFVEFIELNFYNLHSMQKKLYNTALFVAHGIWLFFTGLTFELPMTYAASASLCIPEMPVAFPSPVHAP